MAKVEKWWEKMPVLQDDVLTVQQLSQILDTLPPDLKVRTHYGSSKVVDVVLSEDKTTAELVHVD